MKETTPSMIARRTLLVFLVGLIYVGCGWLASYAIGQGNCPTVPVPVDWCVFWSEDYLSCQQCAREVREGLVALGCTNAQAYEQSTQQSTECGSEYLRPPGFEGVVW